MIVRIIIFFKFFWLDDHILEGFVRFRLLNAFVELDKLLFEFINISFMCSRVYLRFLLVFLVVILFLFLLFIFVFASFFINRVLYFFGSRIIRNEVSNLNFGSYLTNFFSELICSWLI